MKTYEITILLYGEIIEQKRVNVANADIATAMLVDSAMHKHKIAPGHHCKLRIEEVKS